MIVCGAQFGSEGKGNVAAWLSSEEEGAVCVRVGGPNAGHTAMLDGVKYKLQQIPTGALHDAKCIIAAGSEIDLDILHSEIATLHQAGFSILDNLFVDAHATILTKEHSQVEMAGKPHGEAGLTARIGSTGKGVGAARSARIMREAIVVSQVAHDGHLILDDFRVPVCDGTLELTNDIELGCPIIIEGTQGYGLGLHTHYYPHTTSGDVRAIDFLAQAGLSPWAFPGIEVAVWLVARTFPIRVAGNSGPLANEISWEELGQKPEFTTVTNKIRRIGRWDAELVREAIFQNGGVHNVNLALMFLDYVFPDLTGVDDCDRIMKIAKDYITEREDELGTTISAVGTGPETIVRID